MMTRMADVEASIAETQITAPERITPIEPDRRWTQSDITLLRDRVGEGAGLPALADMLRRSPAAVALMLYRLRLRV